MPDYYTPEEVAEKLAVSVLTVRRWCRTGEIVARKFGRSWRIPKTAVDEPQSGKEVTTDKN